MIKLSRVLVVPILVILITTFLTPFLFAKDSPIFSSKDAGGWSAFVDGLGEGVVEDVTDEATGEETLKFDYTANKGSFIGVWTQGLSSLLKEDKVNAIKLGIKTTTPEQLKDISVKLEIKGTKGTQDIPMDLNTVGWNFVQESIKWDKIGDVTEVVFVMASMVEGKSIEGTLYFSTDFDKLSPRALKKAKADLEALLKASEEAKIKAEAKSTYSLSDAKMEGVFNIGLALGGAVRTTDKALNTEVLQFDYSLPKGSIIGVWTKGYPASLNKSVVDAVKIGVNVPNPSQVKEIYVKAELKGKRSMQSIPLTLRPGWNYFRETIAWNSIGDLSEVAFVATPISDAKEVEGILKFDVTFYKLSFIQKNFIFVKIGLIILISLLMGWLISFFGKHFIPRKESEVGKEATFSSRLKRDFLYGIVIVMLLGMALKIYSMGTMSALDAGYSFSFLVIGLMGALVAALLKTGLTGKYLTSREVFQNILLTGLLAASASRQEIFQAPSSWTQILTLNSVIATIAFLVYHVSNMRSLASSGKHIKTVTGALIVCIPYFLRWLLVLGNPVLLKVLGSDLTVGLLSAWPQIAEILGRLLVVFGFNELVVNGIGLAIKGRTLRTVKAHIFILLVSLGVVVAPLIADLGSTAAIAKLPEIIKVLFVLLTTMFSFAGLWGEVYLITGMALDAGKRTEPSAETIAGHVKTGMRKGMWYSGILMTILFSLKALLNANILQSVVGAIPILAGIVLGGLVFPFLKTIMETFDGSLPFFQRVKHSYKDETLYARGMVFGFGFSYAIVNNIVSWQMSHRIYFGLFIGLLASMGVSILRDIVYASRKQGRLQPLRRYVIDGCLGAFIGSALAFYLDSLQIPVVIEKFKLYTSSGFNAKEYITYPLLNKWGRIDLGSYTGGVKLLFTESLAGVINWSIAAWLFAINKVFLLSLFEKQTTPIKFFFSKDGFAQLVEHMIYVLRWGLWMSPIIFTFLRMMPEPTWYNQDGAIRTLVAIGHGVTMPENAFQAWSLKIFTFILASDIFRVLIWMDHMGLRVATMVNLSFIGMDKLDEKVAKFIGRGAAQRYIPEGVKRFCTWAPLLIPFYLPRGKNWDYVWNTSQAMQYAARQGGLLATLKSLSLVEMLILIAVAIVTCTGISFIVRSLRGKTKRRRERSLELQNREYKVALKDNGEVYSQVEHHKPTVFPPQHDISRRSYDNIDPSGRTLFLVDTAQSQGSTTRYWPTVGNFPKDRFIGSKLEKIDDTLKVINDVNGIKTTIDITLPDIDSSCELWEVTVENLTYDERKLKFVPYLEWILNGGLHDRFHTQYARLFPEMEYVENQNAILSWQKSTKSMGVLALDAPPEGILTSRMDFIGRAQSIWKPRALDTLDFMPAKDMAGYPTFDPIGSLIVDASLNPKASKTFKILIGYGKNKDEALNLVKKFLKPRIAKVPPLKEFKKKSMLIGHGEILPGTPQPYYEYKEDGKKLLVKTPYTPRPYDHAMTNSLGQSVMVTNRGLHTSCNGNSQQNRLTPDWPDTVTKEVPAEAIYLYDVDKKEWFSPTYHPLNDPLAKNTVEFGVDGTSVFSMTKDTLSTELTVFVPPDEPMGVYLLKVKNKENKPRKIRVAPYFQMVLEFQPEKSGNLQKKYDKRRDALFFSNPRNMFRLGWAFVSMTLPSERAETVRGRFFGLDRGVMHPYLVEEGKPDASPLADDKQIASFLGTMEIPANGESEVAIILGECNKINEAKNVVEKYKKLDAVKGSLEKTKTWWNDLLGTVKVKTNNREFDYYQNWLKYQAIAERIWARRGFYQTSGAFGYRDQLQDSINLLFVDPALARKQIKLQASHQFFEGDVFHWFFTRTDGRTAFSCRSHASDNPLWLAWAVTEYLNATNDETILDEMTSYVFSEFPFAKLPANKAGWGHLYHRSFKEDSIYRHCLRSIDLVFNKRTGKNGLPLIQTGDWNDGLDEIGSEGKGESVWLGFFLYYIMKTMINVIEKKDGPERKAHYQKKMDALKDSIEKTWRGDRYLRAFHDDGTEIGVKDSGIWEIDALTVAWAVMCGINPERELKVFHTALGILEKDNAVLLGWPALREDSKPYLGRSSKYPEGVRENGMYCHGVQWLIKAARILVERFEKEGNQAEADKHREIAYRLWLKITPLSHVTPDQIEIYGGQPNKQPADILTNFDRGRMIWNGYTGAAGWLFREAMEGVVGASLINNKMVLPRDLDKQRGNLKVTSVERNVEESPFKKGFDPIGYV